MRFAWFTIALLGALGLAMAACALCQADAPSLAERLEAAIPAFGSHKEPIVQPADLAQAIAGVPNITREWAALILTVSSHESALSARIGAGDCKSFECDHGRAWGVMQVHRTARNADVWGSADLRLQVLEGARLMRGAFYQCQHSGVPWPLATIRAYAGRGCDQPIKGEEQRMLTYQRLLRRL